MTDAIQHFSSANPASFDIKDVLEESGSEGKTAIYKSTPKARVRPEPDSFSTSFISKEAGFAELKCCIASVISLPLWLSC